MFLSINRVCFLISEIDYTFTRLPRVTGLCSVTVENNQGSEGVRLVKLLTSSAIHLSNVVSTFYKLMQFFMHRTLGFFTFTIIFNYKKTMKMDVNKIYTQLFTYKCKNSRENVKYFREQIHIRAALTMIFSR